MRGYGNVKTLRRTSLRVSKSFELGKKALPVAFLARGRSRQSPSFSRSVVIGCVGLVANGKAGLLRSLAVNLAARNAGIARVLVSNLEDAVALSEARPVVSTYHYRCLRGADVRMWNLAARRWTWCLERYTSRFIKAGGDEGGSTKVETSPSFSISTKPILLYQS